MKLHSIIDGEGFPLFILHGFLGMGDNWKSLAKSYVEEGFQVHLIDQRNHGRSPHSEDFSYDLLAEDVITYASNHSIDSFHLIGHSMGGKTAMYVACKAPTRVKKLIVADIAPKYYPPHHQEILDALTQLEQANVSARKEAEELLSKSISDQGVRLFLLKNLTRKEKNTYGLRLNLRVLIEKIEEVGKALPVDAIFEGSSLFITGGNSRYVQEEDKALILHHFPSASIATIPDAGHWLHAEKRDEFFSESIQFLK